MPKTNAPPPLQMISYIKKLVALVVIMSALLVWRMNSSSSSPNWELSEAHLVAKEMVSEIVVVGKKAVRKAIKAVPKIQNAIGNYTAGAYAKYGDWSRNLTGEMIEMVKEEQQKILKEIRKPAREVVVDDRAVVVRDRARMMMADSSLVDWELMLMRLLLLLTWVLIIFVVYRVYRRFGSWVWVERHRMYLRMQTRSLTVGEDGVVVQSNDIELTPLERAQELGWMTVEVLMGRQNHASRQRAYIRAVNNAKTARVIRDAVKFDLPLSFNPTDKHDRDALDIRVQRVINDYLDNDRVVRVTETGQLIKLTRYNKYAIKKLTMIMIMTDDYDDELLEMPEGIDRPY